MLCLNNIKEFFYLKLKCFKGLFVVVVFIIFDYYLEKIIGLIRVEIMNKVGEFVDVDVGNLYMLVGKGYNIVFGFKDVIIVIVGLGNVGDFK